MNEEIIKYNDNEYKIVYYYGYNDHYYCTIFENNSGKYLGEIADIRQCENDAKLRIQKFIKNNTHDD